MIFIPMVSSQIAKRVQDRYNLSVPNFIFNNLRLPTVPQNQRVNRSSVALQAEGHPFEPDTAHHPDAPFRIVISEHP
jgi:hypothetical protein